MTTRARAAAVVAVISLVAAPAAAQIFNDMSNHPARRAAERLAAKGIVVRLPDGRLAPDEQLTRLDMAQFLGRMVGIPTSGRPPEFRDVDQIPPADRAAVAAATTLGTVSARKVELKKGSVLYTLSVNKASYAPDEEIELAFSISNVGPGRETEMMGSDRGRHRLKMSERDGLKVGYEGELYVENRTQQGAVTRDLVARVRVTEVRADGSTVDVVEEGKVAARAGLKVFFLLDAWFDYSTSQFYDFVIRDVEGNEIARWSLSRPFLPVDRPIPLAANQTIGDRVRWKQLDQNDRPVKPGRYELIGVHTTKENPTSLAIGFQRGLIPVFPDNTFRPRQPVTRSDLAAFVVRGLGLEAEALRKANDPLQVADARDIPAEVRPHVVLAIERRLVVPLADNTFRPTRTATRGEAIVALNAMMEALGRYDYTTATLREVRGGPPPVVVVEDSNRQIRSHRVSVVHAIYRNDNPVLLLQLRPGDQLKMLKPTDAGEVIYIEASGR